MKNNDGREIAMVWFLSANGDECKRPDDGEKIIFRNEFHGDHDEDWVCIYKGETETERHNPRFISSIIWRKS